MLTGKGLIAVPVEISGGDCVRPRLGGANNSGMAILAMSHRQDARATHVRSESWRGCRAWR